MTVPWIARLAQDAAVSLAAALAEQARRDQDAIACATLHRRQGQDCPHHPWDRRRPIAVLRGPLSALQPGDPADRLIEQTSDYPRPAGLRRWWW